MTAKRRVSTEHARRIVEAVDALEAAKVERDAALVEALKAGASVREVAAMSGMSERHIQTIGHKGGWPTADQRKEWADRTAGRDELLSWVEDFKAGRLKAPPPAE